MKKLFNLTLIFFVLLIVNSNAKISQKNYFAIFSKYDVKDRNTVQKIINKCVNKLGKNNIKVRTNNNGEKILEHKNEKEFLNCTYQNILQIIKPIPAVNSLNKKQLKNFILNNEITFDDGLGDGKMTYIFSENGYIKYKNGKEIGRDGWRWSKLNQLRVFMNGEKTTWRVSKELFALSIKRKTSKSVPFFS